MKAANTLFAASDSPRGGQHSLYRFGQSSALKAPAELAA